MGIADRDYIRRGAPPRAGGGIAAAMRMWSVTTWLIVACVGVYVLDGFMAPRPFETGRTIWTEGPVPGAIELENVVRIQHDDVDLEAKPLLSSHGGEVVGWRLVQQQSPLWGLLHFSTARGFIGLEVWRFIGFQFVHAFPAHLLFNMIAIYFFGPLVERHLGSKRFLAFYLLCGMCGALLYLLLNLGGTLAGAGGGIPFLLFDRLDTNLVGASAGVLGILLAGAFLAPQARVLVFFVLPMRLATLAWVLVGISLLTLYRQGGNAGGEAAHLGGAIAGFYFIRHPQHLHGFFDVLGRVDPTSKHFALQRKPGRPGGTEVDRVLDKVSSKGLHSLTKREKHTLQQATHRAQGQDES